MFYGNLTSLGLPWSPALSTRCGNGLYDLKEVSGVNTEVNTVSEICVYGVFFPPRARVTVGHAGTRGTP